MKRYFVILLAITTVVLLNAGCAQTPEAEPEAVEMTEDEVVSEPDEAEADVVGEEPNGSEMEEITVGRMTDIGYYDVSPEEANMLIDTVPDLVVVDVSPKYDEGHLPGSINYYVGDGSLDVAIPDLDMDKPYLVYCHVDSAAIAGATKLVEAGFDPVYRLEGNYSAWVAAGYPIEK